MNMNKIKAEDLEILIAKEEDLKNLKFNCGDDDLNEFILKDAIENIKANMNTIFLCKYNEKIIAYFALSADSIKIDETLEINYPYYPAVKIGRLAVAEDYQKKNVGSILIEWIIIYIYTIRKEIGIRLISVDAYSKAINFYKNNFFKCIESKYSPSKHTVPMYIDLNKLNEKT